MNATQQKPIAILGAGSWGTALALYLSRRGREVRIWSVDASEIEAMLAEGCNNRFMPGFNFPSELKPTLQLNDALDGVDDVIVVVPSVGFKNVLTALKPHLHSHLHVICASKGLDSETGELLGDMARHVLGDTVHFAVLSGPSFAREVAAGLPTAVVIASKDPTLAQSLKEQFDSDIFHIDISDDVVGVEVGGVVKNVIAIATGIVDGLQLGSNTRSAVMTRGINEIARLGVALGARYETFMGLAGLGDLILTCSDDQSRNRRLGLAIGKGKAIQEAEKEIGQVVEGKRNAESVALLAEHHKVDMPVCRTVLDILQGRIKASEAIRQLLG